MLYESPGGNQVDGLPPALSPRRVIPRGGKTGQDGPPAKTGPGHPSGVDISRFIRYDLEIESVPNDSMRRFLEE